MNKAIASFLKYVPDEEWILQDSHLPWLKLNLDVPVNSILDEANRLYSTSVLHRPLDAYGPYTNTGWKSLSIYGDAAEVTEQTNNIKSWTDIANICPTTVEFIKKYWIIDDKTGRIRFMWLDPQGYILPHTDRQQSKLYETNIAITQPDDCVFRFLDKGTVPFKAGLSFMVDISNKHFVYNNSNEVRTHIIIHAKLKPGIVKQSYEQNFYS